MLKTWQRLRWARHDRRSSWSFHNRSHEAFGPGFGHYLSVSRSHLDSRDPWESRRRRRRLFRLALVLAFLAALAWVAWELLYVIRFF